MATDIHRMFGCPICGYRINETEASCPRCNNRLDSGTKLECPFCGELVDPRVRVCPVCRVDYGEFIEKTKHRGSDESIDELLNEIIKLESVQIKEEPKKFSCPGCSWLLDGTEEKCPKCGMDLTNEFAFQCPICGSPVPSDALTCPECGANFEEEKKEARTEPKPEEPAQPAPEPEPVPTAKPELSELEDLAASFRTSQSNAPPEKAPEPPPEVEEPPKPSEEAVQPAERIEEKIPETAPQEGTEPVATPEAPAKPSGTKAKKRKLKARPGAKPQA